MVVYKYDRLSLSMPDFLQMLDFFKKRGVSFVSVSQRFDTSTPMGEVTLNILLTFAQFERQMTAERSPPGRWCTVPAIPYACAAARRDLPARESARILREAG